MNTEFKAYIVRAAYDYCIHHGLEPYVVVLIGGMSKLPSATEEQGSITYNLSNNAVRDFALAEGFMSFSARFGGQVEQAHIAIDEIVWIGSPVADVGQAFQVDVDSRQASTNVDKPEKRTTNNNMLRVT